MMIVLGADIGGTHITTALINMEDGELVSDSYHRAFVDAQGSAEHIIKSWSAVIRKSLSAAQDVYQIGIAMPGPFDYEAGISQITGLHKYEALYGLNVKELLATELHIKVEDIRMANDARCFLQGELFNGAVKGEQEVTGLTLGTGFGSAIAQNGIAADAAFYNIPFSDSRAEDYFCSRWLVKRYAEISGKNVKNVKEMALITDRFALLAFEEFGANLALFLSTLNPVPTRILLGGNIAQTFNLFNSALQHSLNNKGLHISFVLSTLDENAALLGAASLLLQDKFSDNLS
jgi:glucokinase